MNHPLITTDTLPLEIKRFVGSVVDLEYPAQGATSAVAIIRSRDRTFVVKRAIEPPYTEWLQREYAVLRALTATTLPIPRVYCLVEHPGVQDNEYWLLMDYLPGETLRAVLRTEHDPAIRHGLLAAFGRALATIHRCNPPAELLTPSHSWLDRTLEQAEQYLQHYPVDGTRDLLDRLQQQRPAAVPATLIHGDYTTDNVLVRDGTICGLIDWSGGAIGDPRYDLALATRPHRGLFQTETDLHAFYSGYGSRRLTRAETDYFSGIYEFF